MDREFFDPPWEVTNIVLIDVALLRKAERRVQSCEACNPEDAVFSFDSLLDEITGNDPSVSDYVLTTPAHCPRCQGLIHEKTGVEWDPDDDTPSVGPVPAPALLATH